MKAASATTTLKLEYPITQLLTIDIQNEIVLPLAAFRCSDICARI